MDTDWIDEMTAASPAARFIAWAGELIFEGAHEDDRVGRTVKFRIVRPPEKLGEANPFSTYTRRRKGHAGTRFEAVFSTGEKQAEMMEIMLLNWADGPKGSTVTFVLPPYGDHPFMRNSRGVDAVAVVLLEKDDDEAVVDQVKRDRVENPRRKQKLSTVAAQMCKNPVFQEWVSYVETAPSTDEYQARDWLCLACSIDSRADLDTEIDSGGAQRKFRAICDEFVAWQKKRGLLK